MALPYKKLKLKCIFNHSPSCTANPTCLSKRPGRFSAGSRLSGRLVAAMTMMPSVDCGCVLAQGCVLARAWVSQRCRLQVGGGHDDDAVGGLRVCISTRVCVSKGVG